MSDELRDEIAEAQPYRVPALLNARRTVWAVDCSNCGRQVRMGGGSLAGIKRLIAAVGHQMCVPCRADAIEDGAR